MCSPCCRTPSPARRTALQRPRGPLLLDAHARPALLMLCVVGRTMLYTTIFLALVGGADAFASVYTPGDEYEGSCCV